MAKTGQILTSAG